MNPEASYPSGLPQTLRAPAMTVGTVTPGSLDDQVLRFPAQAPPRKWYLALAFTSLVACIGMGFIGYTFYTGIGAWGNNSPVFWATPAPSSPPSCSCSASAGATPSPASPRP